MTLDVVRDIVEGAPGAVRAANRRRGRLLERMVVCGSARENIGAHPPSLSTSLWRGAGGEGGANLRQQPTTLFPRKPIQFDLLVSLRMGVVDGGCEFIKRVLMPSALDIEEYKMISIGRDRKSAR